MSDFQAKVYETVSSIPRGKVTTYGEIAKVLGCRSSRAIGQALKVNPYSPIVPCHRVVKSDLTLGGFFGSKCSEKKREILESENVHFSAGKIPKEFLFRF